MSLAAPLRARNARHDATMRAAAAAIRGASAKREPWKDHGQPFRSRSGSASVAVLGHPQPAFFPPFTPRADQPLPRADLHGHGRRFEYSLRDELRPLARGRCAGCGRTKVTHAQQVKGQGDDVEVWLRDHDRVNDGETKQGKTRRAYYRNILVCGSAWECPSCMASHRRAGAEKIKLAVERWQNGYAEIPAHGAGSVLFLTLTVRHGLGDDLGLVRRGVTDAFSRFLAGRAWQRLCDSLPWNAPGWSTAIEDEQYAAGHPKLIGGYVRALEVTHGASGWHPHVHALLFCGFAPSEKFRNVLRACLSQRWAECVREVLGEAHVPVDTSADGKHPGCDLRPCGAADYISKMGLELSSPLTKEGRKSRSRSPIQIAIDYATTHAASDAKLWQTYCAGMKGARMLTWSGGLLDRLGLKEEDEEPSEIAPQLVASIDDVTWRRVRDLRGAKLAILVAAEEAGEAGVKNALSYMRKHGKAPPSSSSAQRAGP